jgi:hypothetical protein
MPAQDHHHAIFVRSLTKAGWTVLREQFTIAIGQVEVRRMYIDLQVQSQSSQQIVLMEIKSFEASPVHRFMELVGQYTVYRAALDHLEIDTPLYVAIPEYDYQTILQHILGREVMGALKAPIPFVTYNPDTEEIVRWIPPL